MTVTKLMPIGIAVISAWLGYIVFKTINFPVPALTGAATAVTIISLLGVNADLPVKLRNACILVLGINIGTAVTPEVLETAIHWPATLAVMSLCVLLILAVSSWTLTRWFSMDILSATLASAPGHLSYVLSIAIDANRNVGAIAIIQTVRVLALTLGLPLLVQFIYGSSGNDLLSSQDAQPWHLAATVVVSIPVAILFQRWNVPAAWLIAGMVISALGHGFNITPGRIPDTLASGALMIMGILIGSRFATTPPRETLGYLLPGLVVTALAGIISLLGVVVSFWMMGVHPALLIVAFAPGGVEAMAAIALSLGYDPAFVAAHHVFRLFLLSLLMPYVFIRLRKNELEK